jgi:hypothetical protein
VARRRRLGRKGKTVNVNKFDLLPFRYSTVPLPDREGPYLACEYGAMWKARCRCVHGVKLGPYFYLRYLEWDDTASDVHFRREYVPKTEVQPVRRWIRRYRAENALGRVMKLRSAAFLGPLNSSKQFERTSRSHGEQSR